MKSFKSTGLTLLSCALAFGSFVPQTSWTPVLAAQPEESENGGNEETGQAWSSFMDGFLPMPIVESLNGDCWGAADTGPRDQGNGLEDRTMENYCYWDGTILKDPETGKYYMFASRWDQSKGHGGWTESSAVYATSDNLYGPYTDQGELWPDYYEGAGHNVFAFALSESDPLYEEGYRYGISVSDTGKHGAEMNGSFHVSRSLAGEWEHLGLMNVPENNYRLSNISITVRADGTYEAINRDGEIALSESLRGPWKKVNRGLWWETEGMPTECIEDPVIWYADGIYHCLVNKWDAKKAYYLTSYDGVSDWRLHNGNAYDPETPFLSYEDGSPCTWKKLERPGVYVEDGILKAVTFAGIDVEKEVDYGNDSHGSKVFVVPFDGVNLTKFAREDRYQDEMAGRQGLVAEADANIQSWQNEAENGYGGKVFLQLQGNTEQGVFGEGESPYDGYDCKVGFLRYDLTPYRIAEKGDNIARAELSLVYQSRATGSASTSTIKVTLAENTWIEGTGTDGSGAAQDGAINWFNQPAVLKDAQGNPYGPAESEAFSLTDGRREVKVDVTDLLKAYCADHPEATEVTFAINETSGNRLHIGSKEGGAEASAPRLSVSLKGAAVTELQMKESLELSVGTTGSLETAVLPADAANPGVLYTSSNSSIAQVDEQGRVFARAEGTAEITAETIDGRKQAVCLVHVKANDEIKDVETPKITSAAGYPAALPTQVKVTGKDGVQTDQDVNWQLDETVLLEGGTLHGTLAGSGYPVTAEITARTPGMTYVIDCNNPGSPRTAAVDEYAHLLNETADQKSVDGSWGYMADYGNRDGSASDSYDQGWWAHSDEDIVYHLPLQAGTYHLTLGFKEWWKDSTSSRKMDVSISEDGQTTLLGSTNTWNGSNWWNTFSSDFTVQADNGIDVIVSKQNGQPDPVLSFIEVQYLPETEALKEAMTQAATADLSAASQEKKERIHDLHVQATALLLQAGTSQDQIDEVTRQLTEALNASEKEEVNTLLLEQAIAEAQRLVDSGELENLHPAVAEELHTALEEARSVLADPDKSQESVNSAWQRLCRAIQMTSFTANKDALRILVEQMSAVDLDQYEDDENKTAFLAALAHAQDVLDDENALDETSIKPAYTALEEAFAALTRKPEVVLDLSMLQLLLDTADDLNLDLYVSAGQEEFQAALEEARTIADDPQDQQTIDASVYRLNRALLNLRLKADESILEELRQFTTLVRTMNRALFSAEDLTTIDAACFNVTQYLAQDEPEMEPGRVLLSQIQPLKTLIENTTDHPEEVKPPVEENTKPDPVDNPEKADPSDRKEEPASGIQENVQKPAAETEKSAATAKSVRTASALRPGFQALLASLGAAGLVVLRRKKHSDK